MALPSKGKPTAQQVVDWAKWMADNHKGVDIDGRFGFQCWDLPNYIFNRYWHFRTWGNANAMAQRKNYLTQVGRFIEIHLASFQSRVI